MDGWLIQLFKSMPGCGADRIEQKQKNNESLTYRNKSIADDLSRLDFER